MHFQGGLGLKVLGLDCVVYMGEEDVERQALNVFRMKLLGAEVRPVSSGSRTLKDAINEIGLFGNQNTIYKPTTPKWRSTVERLKEKFPDFDK